MNDHFTTESIVLLTEILNRLVPNPEVHDAVTAAVAARDEFWQVHKGESDHEVEVLRDQLVATERHNEELLIELLAAENQITSVQAEMARLSGELDGLWASYAEILAINTRDMERIQTLQSQVAQYKNSTLPL